MGGFSLGLGSGAEQDLVQRSVAPNAIVARNPAPHDGQLRILPDPTHGPGILGNKPRGRNRT